MTFNQIIYDRAYKISRAIGRYFLTGFLFVYLLDSFKTTLNTIFPMAFLIFLSVPQAKVILGLKMTGQLVEPYMPFKDGFAGLTGWRKYFPTYAFLGLFTALVEFCILTLGLSALFYNEDPALLMKLLENLFSTTTTTISTYEASLMLKVAFMSMICSSLGSYVCEWLFFFVPYNLEFTSYKGIKGLVYAFKQSKGKRKRIFSFLSHYWLIDLFFVCLNALALQYINTTFLASIMVFLIDLAMIYFYMMPSSIGKAIFYQQLLKEEKRDGQTTN